MLKVDMNGRARGRRAVRVSLAAIGGLSAMLQASTALAVGPGVIELAPGTGGPKTQDGGAGNEQPTLVTVTHKGDRYVVVAYMSSNVGEGLDPWQCKCSSIRLPSVGAPQVMANQVYLTKNENTDRPCNHPFLSTDGERILFTYGYAENGGNTQTYVQTIDAMCNPVSAPVRISNNANANQGAPEAAFHGGGQYTVGYYESGAQTYIVGVKMEGDGTLNKTFNDQVVINPSNIGRPAMATTGDRTLLCAAKGDQRPPEDGVACALINAIDGTVYWKNEVVAASEPGNNIYMNQPSLASLGDGRFVLHAIQSTGQGKNTNVKGGSKAHLYILEPTVDGPNVKAHTSGIGAYQTHSAVFAGPYGAAGETFIGFYEAPITGSGIPLITFLKYDSGGQKFEDVDYKHYQWIVGPGNADSGYLPNLYGANPGTQGRDYMRGIAGVPNPGYGVEGGFMKEVKSFFVLPYAGMKKGEEKNALFLSFVPGQTGAPVVPEPPDPPIIPDAPRPAPPALAPDSSAQGCACVVGAPSPQSSAVGGVSALGLALFFAARRRKEG
ncbi:MAG TPA: hypothetical protein VE093_14115 [Polyangiaceae bacterium]|nr:hypothetical protein [Polyangiaceae bacterium]